MSGVPSKEDAIALARAQPTLNPIERAAINEEVQNESLQAFLNIKEHDELIKMRGKWSQGVLSLLAFIVVSDVCFSWALGLHFISFSNDWAVPVFVGDGIVRTLGLAYIVVHFLFNKDSLRGK